MDVNTLNGIDLSLVSPVYGIDRRKTKGVFGTSPNAFKDINNNTGNVMPNDPTRPYSGLAGKKIPTLETLYGITSNNGDIINSSYGVGGGGSDGDKKDLVTFSIAGVGDSKKVYFRTLITSLSETVSPTWDSAKFVGNPYSYYTYGGVERTLSLQLKMYCMNSSELALMWQRIQFLTSKAYPTIDSNNLVNPPFIEFTLGNMYQKKTAFINSLSYTIPDDGVWETLNGNQLPKIVEVQMEFKFVENVGAELKLYGTEGSKDAIKAINNKRAKQSGTTTTVSQEPKTGGGAATPPAPINNVGAVQTEPPKTESTSGGMLGVDSTPKSLDTGKPAETPKENNDPASLASIATTTESTWEVERNKRMEKLKAKGLPEILCYGLSMDEGVDMNSIKKVKENVYSYYMKYGDEGRVQHLYSIVDGNSSSGGQYDMWVSYYNKGVDPLKGNTN